MTVRHKSMRCSICFVSTLHLGGTFSQYQLHLSSFVDIGPPEKPQYLRVSNTTEDKLQLRWIPGFDGGHVQTFMIEYRIEKTDPWTIKTVDSTISNYDPQIYELSGLQSAILFEIRLCAKNKIGTSPNTESIKVSTSNSGKKLSNTNQSLFFIQNKSILK